MERIVMWYVNICFLQLVFTNVALGLRMRYLKIPYIYPSGHDVVLTCDFDLEGEALYAVKWFHDGEEFYRYSPEEDPKAMFFPVRGIKVDMRRANNTSVVLKDIEVWATGMFRCEVLADAPSFHTVTAEAYMIVGEFLRYEYMDEKSPINKVVLVASRDV
ncbi:uncharacterized protein LOC129975442 [Argiope bruennichi]|uniref:uncharacterized protein LOC129975442 n=1 Tax=Argiope bruennichi TaxID=94029 RepID=UPI00249558EA|nr:uncharacterized protein LOC129975442 [Argiope bruennichi]